MTVDDVLEVGLDKAKKSKAIAQLLDIPEREVRLAVRQLIEDGIPVASSTDGMTGGFYITKDRKEAEAYITGMRSRIKEIARRMRDYKIAARPILYPGQLPLI